MFAAADVRPPGKRRRAARALPPVTSCRAEHPIKPTRRLGPSTPLDLFSGKASPEAASFDGRAYWRSSAAPDSPWSAGASRLGVGVFSDLDSYQFRVRFNCAAAEPQQL